MPVEGKKSIRCAVYTRKSSEEGLEQSFNSLDAQREACVAYIHSQRHEGWRVLDMQYDDGGYSGGTMERPALMRLLQDIDAGKIDTVVVYKVDRLTRSLTDFAKIVEAFDARGVSFVSITQQFNTTTSMGRLTLNVLLSFAQFEREVTGERIRDKIAASKKKGMWMGGNVPLGYNLMDRKLVINPAEADLVLRIFRRYVELGCVAKLKAELDSKHITTKVRISKTGRRSGGAPCSRGALYHTLQNRIYLGEITHRQLSYPGVHEAIVPQVLWDKVQTLLKTNRQAKRNGLYASEPSLVAGMLFDDRGNRLTPSHAVKSGKRYRYYVSQAVIQRRPGSVGNARRIPAHDIEDLVLRRLAAFLGSTDEVLEAITLLPDDSSSRKALITAARNWASRLAALAPAELRGFLMSIVSRITINETAIEILITKPGLRAALIGAETTSNLGTSVQSDTDEADLLSLTADAQFRRRGGEVRLILPGVSPYQTLAQPNLALVKAIARGYSWYEKLISGEVISLQSLAADTGVNKRYVSRVVRCALLAPDIVDMILEGRQPSELTLNKMFDHLPVNWAEQRRVLGISGH